MQGSGRFAPHEVPSGLVQAGVQVVEPSHNVICHLDVAVQDMHDVAPAGA